MVYSNEFWNVEQQFSIQMDDMVLNFWQPTDPRHAKHMRGLPILPPDYFKMGIPEQKSVSNKKKEM